MGIIPRKTTVAKCAFWYKSATQLCKGNKPSLKKNVTKINKNEKSIILSTGNDNNIKDNSDKNNVPVRKYIIETPNKPIKVT